MNKRHILAACAGVSLALFCSFFTLAGAERENAGETRGKKDSKESVNGQKHENDGRDKNSDSPGCAELRDHILNKFHCCSASPDRACKGQETAYAAARCGQTLCVTPTPTPAPTATPTPAPTPASTCPPTSGPATCPSGNAILPLGSQCGNFAQCCSGHCDPVSGCVSAPPPSPPTCLPAWSPCSDPTQCCSCNCSVASYPSQGVCLPQ